MTFLIDSIIKASFSERTVSGDTYYLKTELSNAYSYYPEAISSKDVLNEFQFLAKDNPFNLEEILKKEIQKGIELPFQWPFTTIQLNNTEAQVMDQYIEFESDISIDYGAIINYLFTTATS